MNGLPRVRNASQRAKAVFTECAYQRWLLPSQTILNFDTFFTRCDLRDVNSDLFTAVDDKVTLIRPIRCYDGYAFAVGRRESTGPVIFTLMRVVVFTAWITETSSLTVFRILVR